MTFKLLEISEKICKALKEDGIDSPTCIQKEAIPHILKGKDLVGISSTGSGKTVAFGVPLLEKVVPGKGIQILILTPTRELAVQISREMKKFSKYCKCNFATIYGGVSLDPQIHKMKKAEVVVATTGRLVDHMRRGNVDLSKLKCIVLDEADKMVDMGFIEDIEMILSQVPKNKQVLLFGATISDEIEHIKKTHMNKPVTAKADVYVEDGILEQFYYDLKPNEKFSYLVHLLNKEKTQRVMIFCATIVSVEILTRNLKANGINVCMLHGKLRQATRLKIMEDFNKGKSNILVASAVAARGLDIRNVSHVINYELSQDPQEYIHRVGRTARAGESGRAITLLEPRDHEAFNAILQRYDIKVHKLPKEPFKKLFFNVGRGRFDRNKKRSSRPTYGVTLNNRNNERFGRRLGNRSGNRFGRRQGNRSSNRRKFSGSRQGKPSFFSKANGQGA